MLVTKYRRKCLTKNILEDLEKIITDLCERWSTSVLEFGGENDHVHILIESNPNIEPAKLINCLKTVSSRLIRKKYKEHLAQYFWKPVLWTRAYCLLSAGGAPIDIIKKYIENQNRPMK